MARYELYPKDILGTFFIREYFIAEIAVKAEFLNQAAGLREISDLLAKFNVYILALNLTSRGKQQFITIFIDYSKMKGNLDELIEELKRVKFVLEVKYRTKKIEDKIIDKFATPVFNMGNLPAMILSREEFGQVLADIKRRYGTGGEAFLYLIGFNLGKLSGEKYKTESISEDFMREDVLSFQAFGWGIPEIVEIDLLAPRIRLRFYDLFESINVKEAREACCHFFRGYLAGLFSSFLKRDLEVREIKCIAMGDPYCEFIIEKEQKN